MSETPSVSGPPRYALLTAAVLLALYVGLTVAMIVEYAESTQQMRWDRVLVIYNGFSAFAAAAGGVLLGTQVQRVNLVQARKETERAKSAIREALALTEPAGTTTLDARSATAADVRDILRRGL